MKIKLSLLITYYNEGEMLTECIDSLLASTMLPDEILIYDDCSPRPAEDFVVPHPNIRIIRGETNRGASYARDYLLREAAGEYVHYHDTDDLFLPEWCEEIMRAIEENPGVDLFINNWQWQETIGGETITGVSHKNTAVQFEKSGRDPIKHFILNGANTPSMTFRRILAIDMGGYQTHNLTTGLDWYFNLCLARHVKTCHLIDKPLVLVKFRSDSISRGEDGRPRMRRRSSDRLVTYSYLLNELPEKYHPYLAQKALQKAVGLFRAGFEAEAQKTFDFAHELAGDEIFNHYRPLRRLLIRIFGFQRSLHIADSIRRIISFRA